MLLGWGFLNFSSAMTAVYLQKVPRTMCAEPILGTRFLWGATSNFTRPYWAMMRQKDMLICYVKDNNINKYE